MLAGRGLSSGAVGPASQVTRSEATSVLHTHSLLDAAAPSPAFSEGTDTHTSFSALVVSLPHLTSHAGHLVAFVVLLRYS